nr:NAD-dependent malic enzyme [Betaproteobacteria bacterium]
YIFPGIGLGVHASAARLITQHMFLAAAEVLANSVSDLDSGAIYPPLTQIREVSCAIAGAVFRVAVSDGLTEKDLPNDLESYINSLMYEPTY